MAARQCYHCKQWVQAGEQHDCWTTTERALTEELSEDLQEAWLRLRETAAGFGEQRIYASHHSIMFSRASCYFFVRPKKSYLEVCVFLGRMVKGPQVRRVERASRAKFVHFVRVSHRDQVEPPITDWLQEAYDHNLVASGPEKQAAPAKPAASPKRKRSKAPTRARRTAAARKSRRG